MSQTATACTVENLEVPDAIRQSPVALHLFTRWMPYDHQRDAVTGSKQALNAFLRYAKTKSAIRLYQSSINEGASNDQGMFTLTSPVAALDENIWRERVTV